MERDKRADFSPQVYARAGGVLYLIVIVVGFFGVFVRGSTIVSRNAAATAANIKSSELLWRLGIAGDLFMLTCGVALALILYVLLRPTSRILALLAAFFGLVSLSIEAAIHIHLLQALFVLGDADYLKAFTPAQLDALAYVSVRSHAHGFGVNLIFFGCMCVVVGYLIFRSGYLPRTVGVLMQIAGVSYLTNSYALLVVPAVADLLFPWVLLPAFVGEASLCLWLLVKGVDARRWTERAATV